jgi:hypothetical protein
VCRKPGRAGLGLDVAGGSIEIGPSNSGTPGMEVKGAGGRVLFRAAGK